MSFFCHIVAFGEIKHTGMFKIVAASTMLTGYLAALKDKKLQKITLSLAFFNTNYNKTNKWDHIF